MPTALIVEDEPEANKLLGMLIRLRGYHPSSAFNGREALEQVGRQAPDVVFLDLMLPDVSGFEVCRAVKGAKATCLVPLIIVSARLAQRNRVESFHAGADEFVAKPYTPDQIFGALKFAENLGAQAARERVEGSALFGDPDDPAPARELSRVRSLVLGKTPLDEGEAGRLNAVIDRAETEIDRWTRTHPAEARTALDYEVAPDGLRLTFREQLGWIDFFQVPEGAGLDEFDEVSIDRDERRLTLVKRWS